MIVAGKEFPNTPDGWRAAATHIETLGPTFYDDARDFWQEGNRMERDERLRKLMLGFWTLLIVGLAAKELWAWATL